MKYSITSLIHFSDSTNDSRCETRNSLRFAHKPLIHLFTLLQVKKFCKFAVNIS